VETAGRLRDLTAQRARALKVKGLINVQYAIKGDVIYVLEANPRASRTVPFVSKAAGIPLVDLAVAALLGEPLPEEDPEPAGLGAGRLLISVKKAVLPFDRFPGEDTLLGPEMKSTGEVMGTGADFGEAYAKAQAAAGEPLPTEGSVFLSVPDADKRAVVFMAKKIVDMGFRLVATKGTARFIRLNGIPVDEVYKVGEGRPTVVDLIGRGAMHLILNEPLGGKSKADERDIRLAAMAHGVPCVTSLAAASAAVCGIEALRTGGFTVRALQDMEGRMPAGSPAAAERV
jgi:carbamoyl-phosphate synthase large subunit